MRHLDDGGYQRGCVGVLGHVLDKGLVDLDIVHGELLEVAERGIAGAEVVDRDRNAQFLEAPEDADGIFLVLHERAFGDLKREEARVDARFPDSAFHGLDQVFVQKLQGREIHRNGNAGAVVPVPVIDLPAGGFERPGADIDDHAGLFEHGNELRGRDHAELVVVPFKQGLCASDLPGREVVVGLEGEGILVISEGFGEAALHEHQLGNAEVHVRGIKLVMVSAQVLCLGQGRVRVLHEGAGVMPVGGEHGDADGEGDRDLFAARHDDLRHVFHDHFNEEQHIGGAVDIVEHHAELVAAQAADHVPLAD